MSERAAGVEQSRAEQGRKELAIVVAIVVLGVAEEIEEVVVVAVTVVGVERRPISWRTRLRKPERTPTPADNRFHKQFKPI